MNAAADVLEAGVVDDVFGQDLRVRELESLRRCHVGVALRREGELADSAVDLLGLVKGIAGDHGASCAQAAVKPCGEAIGGGGRGDRVREGGLVQVCVEGLGVDDGVRLLGLLGAVEKERSTRGDGTVEGGRVVDVLVSGFPRDEGIERVEARVVAADVQAAVKAAGSGFGEDLDPAIGGVSVVLGGVGILVDANLADGVARGKRAV